MRRATLLWALLAAAGVLLVAGVTLAASTLSTQTIGLSSEPLSAGDRLTPAPTPKATEVARRDESGRGRGTDDRRRRASLATPTVAPTAIPTAPPVATTDDDGFADDNSGSGSDDSGHGRGRGRGRGGDDDD
jgi:hypothetical protein